MTIKVSHGVVMTIKIDDGPDVGNTFTKFEWASFINGGYIIRARLLDPYFNILKNIATKNYLKDGRKKETAVKFIIQWATTNEPTTERTAFITDLKAHGINESGELEFVAIDPPSFYLNEGTADGRAYVGNVTKVIKQVVKDFAHGNIPEPEMTETKDNKQNVWWMMRQDPKTFIRSILDWSASVTPQKTHWIVASVDKKLIIKEQADFKVEEFGSYRVNKGGGVGKDVLTWEMISDNFLSPLQSKLITSGISAISGEYLDKTTDVQQQKVVIKDENTGNKTNARINQTQGFAKPQQDWATSIMAIPEHSGGEMGVVYGDYIDGRARGMFLNMLNLVMRLKLRVFGEHKMDDSSKLGVAACTVTWQDIDGEPYFLSGRWLVYGFHHTVTRDNWVTDLYLSRLDYDASAVRKI